MAFVRKIKKKDSVYLAEVENYREGGKVKQRVIRYIGKEHEGEVVRKVFTNEIEIESVRQYLDYKILHEIASRIGIPDLLGEYGKYILLLVYTQIVCRKPLYKIPEYIAHTALREILEIQKIIDKNLYTALDELEELDFRVIESEIYRNLRVRCSKKEATVIDVTDTYFSGSQADWKSRKGKDGQYSKLLQIALAVTKHEGFPITHKVYEGNISNIRIFQDFLSESTLREFDVIIIDRGMDENLLELKRLRQKVISGLRINERLKRQYLSRIDREEIFQPQYQVKLKNTKVYVKDFEFQKGRIITVYNPEIEIAKRMKAMEMDKDYKPEEAKYMGYSFIYHTTELTSKEVVKAYYEKDIVEKAFKELKSSINLRPIRKYLLSHIKAHIKICYLAYAILSYIQWKLKDKDISAVSALEKLQPVYKVEMKSEKEDFHWSRVVTLTKEQDSILKALGCSV